MPTFRPVTSEDLAKQKRELTQQFPSAKFGWPPDLESSLLEVLLSGLKAGGEDPCMLEVGGQHERYPEEMLRSQSYR